MKNDMKFIMIFGPHAVGKMTIGRELEKITDLKLFHNHMTIELITPFFEYGSKDSRRLIDLFRMEIFKAFAKTDSQGMIFTYIWALDLKEEWENVKKITNIFEKENSEIIYVELESDVEERVERNKSEFRLKEKPTKRDVEWSEKHLRDLHKEVRMNSHPDEIKEENYLRINNTKLEAEDVAKLIKEKFNL